MHDGLPPPIPSPTINPANDLGRAPDRAHFLYGLSCVSMGIATAAGFCAILHEQQLSEEALMIVFAVMAGTASLSAFIFGMLAHYARKEDRLDMARAQQAMVDRIQDLEEEQESLKSTLSDIEQAERTAYALWTPDVVAAHVLVKANSVAIVDRHKDTGKPVIIVEWLIVCAARVPCDVLLAGGTCAVFRLSGPPGDSVCSVRLGGVIASFDGTMAPGEITARKHSIVDLSGEDVVALHSKLAGTLAARCLIEVQANVKTPGGNHVLEVEAEQPVVEFRPWLRNGGEK